MSHETVRYWWNRFGPMFAAEIRRKRVQQLRAFSKWKWHVDEVFVKVNGTRHYLWRAVDHEGEVLAAVVTKRRNKAAALKFLKKLMKRHGKAEEVVTDRFASYKAALRDLGALEKQMTADGSITVLRIRTCRSDEENAPCNGSGVCEVCRNSLPSTPPSTTISTRKDR